MQARAVVYVKNESGSAGEFVLKETFECPAVDERSVVVKVKACGLTDKQKTNKVLEEFHLLEGREEPVGREISGIVTRGKIVCGLWSGFHMAAEVGSAVTRVSIGDEVAGFVPLVSQSAGCSNFCVISEYDVVPKPEKVSHVDAAACIGDGLRAYTALHYHAQICGGETVLIFDGASASGIIAIQLAQCWGAKVMATVSSEEEVLLLQSLQPPLSRVIDLRQTEDSTLVETCLEETGGLGLDCVIDNGVTMYSEEFTEHVNEIEIHNAPGKHHRLPNKCDIINCLAVGGRWVTSQSNLQLDPPDSQLLYLKSGSLCFLFEFSWTLSRGQQGRYLHMVTDLMDKLSNSLIRPVVHHTVSLDDACKALKALKKHKVGKVVVTL